MDLDYKLKKLEKSIDEYEINIYDSVQLAFFRLPGYTKIIVELNKARNVCESYFEKKDFIDKYKKVYLSSKKMYNRLLRNLNGGTLKVYYHKNSKNEECFIYKALGHLWKFDKEKYFEENISNYIKAKLKQRICEVNEELFKLNKYPTNYTNCFSTFIGPYSISKYEQDIICYKDVFIALSEYHHFSIFYNENTEEETKRALLNILAYFNGKPYFYFTENYNFNKKIWELYEYFDLLDIILLGHMTRGNV